MPALPRPAVPAWALAAAALALLTGCATADAAAPPAAVLAGQAPPDLAGHQFDRPHADRVLVAGDTTDLGLRDGTVRVRVTGPALQELPTFAPRRPGELAQYRATFTVRLTALSGTVTVRPQDFRLLDLSDQVGTAAPVPHDVVPTASDLPTGPVPVGTTVTGTWTAPFTEGHGELLYDPPGLAPLALWDFRAES